MTFIYFACEVSRIFNAITCETLILNYNSEFNLGFFFFLGGSFTYSCYDFSSLHIYIYIYIYNFKKNYLTLWFDY